MRLVFQMIAGAAVGFILMYLALSMNFSSDFSGFAFAFTLLLLGITILLLVLGMVSIVQMNKKAKMTLSGDEEDERDRWQYKRYSDTTLGGTVALVLSIVSLGVAVITEQPIWLLIVVMVTTLAASLLTTVVPAMIKVIYPDRELPNVAEKDYAKKLLAASDEGERHVMLEGLYRTFTTLNVTLLLALVLLIVYSVGTGVSQLFAIFVIALILIIANAQYLFSIRNKS
jgi:hypothetical protein